MSRVKFILNEAGVRDLLKSGEMESICMVHAARIQGNAGEHYTAEARHYPERSGAAVYPSDAEGYFDNLENNTLLKELLG